jgi:hypothetical protein
LFRDGRSADLFIIVLLFTAGYWFYRSFRKSSRMPIRRIRGLDSIDDAIGRATEMGRPVHFTTGCGGLVADTMAAFAVLEYVARQSARYNASLIVTNSQPVVQPMTENIVKSAYVSEWRADSFQPGNIRYLSDTMQAYVVGVWGILEREQAAANIMMGYFYAESLLLAEGGSRAGAFQIAGTASTPQLPFFVAACDYTLIGEELFAAGAYLSENPVRVGALMAQDIAKILAIGLIAAGSLAASAGWSLVAKLCDY